MGKLSAKKAEAAGPGKHLDGDGLQLVVSKAGRKQWVYRFMLERRAREMGLGAFPDVTLAHAREKAGAARALVKSGRDPIDAAKAAKEATFGAMAEEVITSLSEGFRNEKHCWQWRQTLEAHCAPIWAKSVDKVTTEDVLAILKPLWLTKQETASRLRGRIERVLAAAEAKGLREGKNPAQWRNHLQTLLPKRQKLQRGHHLAMPFANVPAFVLGLREREAITAQALEFCILTAARSGEVLGARWSEIDLDNKLWTVPGERMKAGKIHRVPLTPRAVEIVEKMSKAKVSEYVFPGRAKNPLSNMAFAALLRRMKADEITTTHGFRSAFRDWAGDETSFAREVVEGALAHLVGNEVERAYRRSDALEKRRELMLAWSNYLDAPNGANVVKLRA